MLTLLTIRDFALIPYLKLELDAGLTTLTGETGAGKSIMLDAIALVIGQRADSSVIRTGAAQCEISAVFDIQDNDVVKAWLTEHFSDTPLDEVVLTRILNRQGRSRSLINGSACHLQTLRALGEQLVHIHGQNQQYHLMKPEVHRAQLDLYAQHDGLVNAVAEAYHQLYSLQQQHQEIQATFEGDSEQQLLHYQRQELEALALADGEVERLHQQQRLLGQAQQSAMTLSTLQTAIGGDDDNALGVRVHRLQQTLSTLVGLGHNQVDTISELLEGIRLQLVEVGHEVTDLQRQLCCDPCRLAEIEQRLDRIHEIARKHRVPVEQLWTHFQDLQAKLVQADDLSEQLVDITKRLERANTYYAKLSGQLSHSRKTQAPSLAAAISDLIKRLGIADGEVRVSFEALPAANVQGQDRVIYLARLNMGSDFKPLAKVASGGELARISLAIQVLTAEKKGSPTLIFDEVDTGIGGAVAAKVGELLRQLGKSAQVFCVTHQAQVASYGHTHLSVEKRVEQGQTLSTVKPLQGEARIKELARMISGASLTPETVAHAKSLLSVVG